MSMISTSFRHAGKNDDPVFGINSSTFSGSGFPVSCPDPTSEWQLAGTLTLTGSAGYICSFGFVKSEAVNLECQLRVYSTQEVIGSWVGDTVNSGQGQLSGDCVHIDQYVKYGCYYKVYSSPSHKIIYDNLSQFPEDASFYPTDQQEFQEDEDFWLSVTAPDGWRLTGVNRNSVPIDVPAGGAISLDHQDVMGTEDIHYNLEFTELDDWAKGLRFIGISSSGKAYTHDFVASANEAWNAWPILDDFDDQAETPINTAILRSSDGKALAPGVYRLYVDADPDPGLFSEVLVPAGNGAKSIGFPLGAGIPYAKLGGYWEIVYAEGEEKGVPGPLTDLFPVTPDEPPAPPPDEPDEEIEYLPTPEIPELPDPEIPELPTLSGTCTDPCLCDIAVLLQCLCSRLSCLDQHLVQVGNLVANGIYSHGVAVVAGLNRIDRKGLALELVGFEL